MIEYRLNLRRGSDTMKRSSGRSSMTYKISKQLNTVSILILMRIQESYNSNYKLHLIKTLNPIEEDLVHLIM